MGGVQIFLKLYNSLNIRIWGEHMSQMLPAYNKNPLPVSKFQDSNLKLQPVNVSLSKQILL